jgi:hypothetical protein
VTPRTIRWSLFVAAVLIVWGPPALRPAGRELDAALANPFALDPAAILQVGAWVFAAALAMVLLLSHIARRTPFLSRLLADRTIRWYWLFGLLGLASMTYSSSPYYTAYFAQKIIVGILVLALLEWHWPARRGSRALDVLFLVYSLQAAAIGLLYFFARDWVTPFGSDESGPVRLTGGVFADYGASALLAGLFFISVVLFGRSRRRRLLALAAYGVSWWLMVLSETRSTMAAALIFLIIMLHAHPRARAYGSLIAIAATLVLAGLLPTVLQEVISVGTRKGEGLDTLSGRTVAFAYLIERWKEAPILGYGFAAGTRDRLIDFVARAGLNIGAGHDALSTVLVDLGLAGLALLLAALLGAWLAVGRLFQSTAHRPATVSAHQVACLLVWVTIRTGVSTSLASPYLVFIVAIVATWALARRQPRSTDTTAAQPAGRLTR